MVRLAVSLISPNWVDVNAELELPNLILPSTKPVISTVPVPQFWDEELAKAMVLAEVAINFSLAVVAFVVPVAPENTICFKFAWLAFTFKVNSEPAFICTLASKKLALFSVNALLFEVIILLAFTAEDNTTPAMLSKVRLPKASFATVGKSTPVV